MKRTAKAFAVVAGLSAGLGGCMAPKGEQATTGAEKPAKIVPADTTSSAVMKAKAEAAQVERTTRGQMYDPNVRQVNGTGHLPPNSAEFGPQASRMGMMLGHGGILPSPGMGPPGAVAGVGFGGPSQFGAYTGQRTSVRFASPAGMKIAFQDPARGFIDAGREAPVRYNFPQGNIYRVRVSGIPNRPGKNYYPTIEVYPATTKTITFLSHSTVPVGFTDEDLDQVNSGNLVVKVIYLPDPQFQDLAVAEEIVSTRLEAGVDPIMEANRRGTILAIVRIGNIDLEDPNTPAMDAPGTFGVPAPRPVPAPSAPMTMPGSAMKAPDSLPALTVPGLPK